MSPALRAAFGPGATCHGVEPQNLPFPRTALPIRHGAPLHLEAHLERLHAGAKALGSTPSWLAEAAEELGHWLKRHAAPEAALRLELRLDLKLMEARLEPLPQASIPYRLAPLPHPMGDLRPNPLAPHKGLSGPWRPQVLAEVWQHGAEDALLLWPDGTLAETAIATVALEREGILTLPPAAGRVASVAERLDLPLWAEARGWTVHHASIPREDCSGGQIWCMNALRGLWPAVLL
ncbi:aminotransferase class IV [Geothrix oryzisoli]|uniref:aminotransferase class IV n=1 Tax=Geothrix oryzisoli TaxID=2922721 RepID=UPI001FAD3CAA|nr:aminotransferase class IV [Geothrix oryzisoli]